MPKDRKRGIIAVIIIIILLLLGLRYCTQQTTEETTSEGGMLQVHYYDANGNEIVPGTGELMSIVGGTPKVHSIGFDINVQNTGAVPLENVRLTSSSPAEFTTSLSSATPQTLAATDPPPGPFTMLWQSDLIDPIPLEAYVQPVQFCVSVDADYRGGTGEVLVAGEKSDCLGLTILPDQCPDGTPRGECSPSTPFYCEKHVGFRTNVVASDYTDQTKWVAVDFDKDGDLDSFTHRSTAPSGTSCTISNDCGTVPTAECILGYSPEGYKVVYYNDIGRIKVCDTVQDKAIQYEFGAGAELYLYSLEPYTSNGQEAIVVDFIKKASVCGCPQFQDVVGDDCVLQTCTDGTDVGTCINPPPGSNLRYCQGGTPNVLVEKCGTCGCTDDYYGNPSTGCDGSDLCTYQSYAGSFEVGVS